jgi:hypothetical protein
LIDSLTAKTVGILGTITFFVALIFIPWVFISKDSTQRKQFFVDSVDWILHDSISIIFRCYGDTLIGLLGFAISVDQIFRSMLTNSLNVAGRIHRFFRAVQDLGQPSATPSSSGTSALGNDDEHNDSTHIKTAKSEKVE